MSNHNWIMVSLCLIGLTACGGGGSSSPSTPVSSAISTNQYLPAQNGAAWTYSDDNTGQSYKVTSSPVTVNTDGSETFSLNWPHSGFKQSFEYKDQRLYLDGLTFNQVMVNGTRYTAQFDISTAPFLLLPAYAELGERSDAGYSEATTTITPDPGPAYTSVLPIWKNHGIETVVTQHGSYEAVHIEFVLAFDVTVYSPTYGAISLDQIFGLRRVSVSSKSRTPVLQLPIQPNSHSMASIVLETKITKSQRHCQQPLRLTNKALGKTYTVHLVLMPFTVLGKKVPTHVHQLQQMILAINLHCLNKATH